MADDGQKCPAWPQPRDPSCPFDPPREALELAAREDAVRVQLWDGSTPWLITRHAAVKSLLKDPRISADTTREGFPQPNAKAFAGRAGQRQFQRMDNPVHDVHRRMVSPGFGLKEVERFRPFIVEAVDRLLADMKSDGNTADFQRAFATMVPAYVTCELLDLPVADAEFFDERINTWTSLTAPMEESAKAAQDVLQYFADLIDARMDSDAPDLVSTLIREQLQTGHLTKNELQHMLHLLVIGGFDTTANMLTLGTMVLLRHPDQLEELKADPTLWPQAIEELLRYLSVTQHVAYRLALEDIDIAGVTIKAGEGVIAPINIANRDASTYDEPNTFDIHRNPRNHLAFGFGVHQCLGQQLARLELKIAFPRIFEELPGLRIAAAPAPEDFKDSLVYGLQRLAVAWD